MWAILRGSWSGKPALSRLPDGRTAPCQRLGALEAEVASGPTRPAVVTVLRIRIP
ncbi:hypothetical protein ACPCSC_33000 [Streptomyces lavendulocolor]|uniref:hypothetical protein n=1 Tax=Streptomyces lavendulocolor TaxID=67316 RepID=UPI003C2B7575